MGVYKLSASGGLKTARTGFSSMMAGNTVYDVGSMVPIATTPLSNAVVFAFGNIPQTYQDLFIVVTGVMNTTSDMGIDDINNLPNGGIYLSRTILGANGSSSFSERGSNTANALIIATGNTTLVGNANSFIVHIPNYTNSTTFKTVLARKASDNNGSGNTSIVVGTMQTTSPITYFKFSSQNPACYFTTGTATLYGIKAAA